MRILPFLCLIILISCQDNSITNPSPFENEVDEKKLPLVTVHEIRQQKFNHYHKIQGSVVSKNIAFIRAEIPGTVNTIYVTEGEYVTKGQKLLSLSITTLAAQLAEIDEKLSFASFIFEKQKKLFEDDIITEIQLKEAESTVESLKKARVTLKTQLDKSSLLAPFDGYVEATIVQVGESISPVNPAFHLVGTKNLFLAADVSENLLSDISLNNPIIANFPSINETLDGLKITRIGKLVNPTDRTVKIEAKLTSPNIELIPNLMGIMSINDYSVDSAICLSSRLILKNAEGETFIKVLDKNNVVNTVFVQLGKQEDQLIEVLSKIELGTLVVDQGKSTVLEGQEVKVISDINS
jgi:RND family efflux transporter MFP subunit